MAYLGQAPNKSVTTPTSQYFNGDGSTTAFTLNRGVNYSEELEVFVDNIQQEPGTGKSYTASGTTLTFDEAPATGTGNIYVIYRGQAQVGVRLEHDANASISATDGTFTGDVSANDGTFSGDVKVGTGTGEAPLHVLSENSHGINAIFGAKDFVDNSNYNYADANIALQGRDADNNDTGAGVQYTVRNTGNSNWLHGYSVMNQDGSYRIGTGGAGTTAATQRMQIDANGKVIVTGPNNTTSSRSTSSLMPQPDLIIHGTKPPMMENRVEIGGTSLNWFYEGFPRRYGNSSNSTFQTVTLNGMFIANNSTTTRDMFNLGFDKGWAWHLCEIEVFGIYYVSGYRKYLLRNHSGYSTPFVTKTQEYGYTSALSSVTMSSNGRFLHGTRTATSTSAHDTSYYDMHVELSMPAYSRAFVRVTFFATAANNFRYGTDILNGREVRLYSPV